MKTFSTNGTGSQQTLSEIESDKMPIYNTMADAEADLANLEEGQLVGIEDTGDELAQPVDTVEAGNLHAVTSNAVAEALSYSTEEVNTGKKWIDGKPIYRQTFNIGNLPNNTAKVVNISISNLNDIIKVEGIANTTNIVLPIPYTSPDNTERISVYVAKVWGNITVNTISDMSSYYGCITLEYTKTTD